MNTQKHKIEVHYTPPLREVDNLEAMIADAARDARDGLQGLRDLGYAALGGNELNIKTLTDIIEQKRILTDQFRHTIRLILANLESLQPDDVDAETADAVRSDFRKARHLSQRVSDLIDAEHMIGKKRQPRS